MKVAFLTNEYPPYVYGGAGVHVDYLSRSLSKLCHVYVNSFGDQNSKGEGLSTKGYKPCNGMEYSDPRFSKAMEAFSINLRMAANLGDVDIVHCHTWYSHLGGLVAKQLSQAKMVLTTHSLEPHRPWKVEQLGNAYHLSSWVERTAIEQCDGVIAVSKGMKKDVIDLFKIPEEKVEVIYNGIDLDEYSPKESKAALHKYGVNPDLPYVLFVGRVTRQKGILHLVRAIPEIDKNCQIVLCAGAPDTKEILRQMQEEVAKAKKEHLRVFWIEEMVPKKDVIELYTHASVFCCPSIYEPFGIINLEAMACRTPVVACAVGGIVEVVVDNKTGFLIPFEPRSSSDSEPKRPHDLSSALAEKINVLVNNEKLRKEFEENGRRRVEEKFSWDAIAKETFDYYKRLIVS